MASNQLKMNPGGSGALGGFMSQLRNPELMKPQSFIMGSKEICPIFVQKGDVIFIILKGQQTLPSALSIGISLKI